MPRPPRVDTTALSWERVLSHRPPADRSEVAERLERAGITPDLLRQTLSDAGDALHAAAQDDQPDWADAFGGPLGVALLAAEVSALAAHLNSRASSVRARAVDSLLEQYSAVTVAAELGVSRQKVYDVARAAQRGSDHISRVPWSADEHPA